MVSTVLLSRSHRADAGPPFNMNPLRDRLQVLLQDDRVERLNAELKPGAVPGEAILEVAVQETNPFRAYRRVQQLPQSDGG